jgi:hypothetical protein
VQLLFVELGSREGKQSCRRRSGVDTQPVPELSQHIMVVYRENERSTENSPAQ